MKKTNCMARCYPIVSVSLDTRKTHQICVIVRHNFVYTIKSAHADTSIKETPVLKGHLKKLNIDFNLLTIYHITK
jgi:hypothetical protein